MSDADLGPQITVGITCYREGVWLRDCWQSVLDQTDNRWAAVLIMDGGADEATQQQFAQIEHPRLQKFAFDTNVGPYIARNKAFELTQTPYHFYLDGDDQLLPNALAAVLTAFADAPEAGFVYGDYQRFGASDRVVRFRHQFDSADLIHGQIVPGACAYKKTTWEQVGKFSAELAYGNGDYDFFIGAAEQQIGGKHCGEIIYRQRVGRGGNVSSSYKRNYHRTHETMVKRHPRFFASRQRRRTFLAYGYRQAAIANGHAGNRRQTMRLSLLAMRFGLWRDKKLAKLILKSFIPKPF